ncbi:MAG: SpoIIE family protein phosphatase [Sphingobacteriaceae bacterium]|nr:SpoIIE family protein phosphatase [Sphingobacteriaceae bacterium]
MKIAVKLTITFFIVAITAMLVTGAISYYNARATLKEESFNKLIAVREMKASQLTAYFSQIRDQLIALAEDPFIAEAMNEFKKGYYNITEEIKKPGQLTASATHINEYIDSAFTPYLDQKGISVNPKSVFSRKPNTIILQDFYLASNPNELGKKHLMDTIPVKCTYNSAHIKYHPVIRSFLERFGYYDIFLIDVNGAVIYSVYKETDFASSLTDGPFVNTNLALCYKKALHIGNKNEAALVDFSEYLPSYNAHASFMGTPIYEKGKIIGVLVFQMPIDNINKIMTNDKEWEKVGLGKTGETYIVGENYTLRNQSRFLIEDSSNYFKMLKSIGTPRATISKIRTFNSSVGLQEVKTIGTDDALKGHSNNLLFKDYRGVPVLSAFKPLSIFGMNWVIMSEIDEDEAFSSTETLKMTIIKAFFVMLILMLIASVIVSRQITKPLKELKHDAVELSKGNLDVKININRSDEIGSLADSFRMMQASLSDLIHGLEDKVKERTKEVQSQNQIILHKQKEHIDSLNYAKRIQDTLLATDKFLNKYLPDHFLLFKPKDIVSGDFYWATKNEKYFYIAICDSTGHGVPGAFMSLLNMAFLNEAINMRHIEEPHEIMNFVRERLIANLSKDGRQDGMDGVLLRKNIKTGEYDYSAAHNAPVIISSNEIIECAADKMPIGKGVTDKAFTLHELQVKKGDVIVIYTDGYADQFGGPKGKKLMYKPLKEKLKLISELPLGDQKEKLDSFFEEWRGDQEQVDDICMLGVKV